MWIHFVTDLNSRMQLRAKILKFDDFPSTSLFALFFLGSSSESGLYQSGEFPDILPDDDQLQEAQAVQTDHELRLWYGKLKPQ